VRSSGAPFTGVLTVQLALPRPPADDEHGAPSALNGLLAHLDDVYGLALTLTGHADHAADLTEHVFESLHDDLWSTLGGHRLRERLLARCVAVFAEGDSWRDAWRADAAQSPAIEPAGLTALLRRLPWPERAAIALVDQLGLAHADAAAVLGVDVAEFRTILHRGRGVLFATYRAGARR
jgi:DNA-directed RNA polymerase specialized sigma24 family protein